MRRKWLIFLALWMCLALPGTPAGAYTSLDDQIPGAYYYIPFNKNPATGSTGYFTAPVYHDSPAYCLNPYILSAGSGYREAAAGEYSEIDADALKLASLYAFYGTGYGNDSSWQRTVAAQGLIWKATTGMDTHYSSGRTFWKNGIPQYDDRLWLQIRDKYEEIQSLVKRHSTPLSLSVCGGQGSEILPDQGKIRLETGKSYVLRDRSGVLDLYDVLFPSEASYSLREDGTCAFSLSQPGDFTIRLRMKESHWKAGEIYFILNHPVHQDLIVRGSVEPTEALLHVHVENVPVTFRKDDPDSQPVSGAALSLYQEGVEEPVDQWTSSHQPHSSLLVPGMTYTLRETAAPQGYYRAEDLTFTVPSAGSGPIVMTDAPIEAYLQKADEQGNPIPGVALQLFETTGSGESLVHTFLSGESPLAIGAYLKAGSSYRIYEPDVPDGYAGSAPLDFSVSESPGDPIRLTVVNRTLSCRVRKLDEEGNYVTGARLTLTDITDPSHPQEIASWTTKSEDAVLRHFRRGHTYRLREVEWPDGYTQAEDITFTIPESGLMEAQTIVMTDERVNISFLKVDDAGAPVKGARLQILDRQGEVLYELVSDGTPEGVKTDIAGNPILLKGGESYILRERETPPGYQQASDVPFTVSAQKAVQVVRMVDERTRVRIQVRKADAEDPGLLLPGAEFTLYDPLTGEIAADIYGSPAKKATGADGTAVFEMPYAEHEWILRETRAPSGYSRSSESLSVAGSLEEAANGAGLVQMTVSDRKIPVPDTASSMPPAFSAASLLSAALLAGILRRKRKS